jgi:hypothetical protein
VLEIAERILKNLQTGIVDSTMSTAAGLEKESPFPTTRPALPYYQPTDISFGYNGSESA